MGVLAGRWARGARGHSGSGHCGHSGHSTISIAGLLLYKILSETVQFSFCLCLSHGTIPAHLNITNDLHFFKFNVQFSVSILFELSATFNQLDYFILLPTLSLASKIIISSIKKNLIDEVFLSVSFAESTLYL